MGAAPAALLALGLIATAVPAHGETCTGVTPSGGRFATCFDVGNRLSLTTGSHGVGASIALRHEVRFVDEPDLIWKLEHTVTDVRYGAWRHELDGALYRGRYLRHARDGHIVLPLGIPKKVFLPFDIGGLAEAGVVRWRPEAALADQLHIGVVKVAGLIDLSRTRSYRRRFVLGPVAKWDVEVDRSMGRLGKVSEHAVTPFAMLLLNLHAESKDGLYVADLRAEAGTVWHTRGGWKPEAQVEATLERIVIALNDRPVSITVGASYDTTHEEAIARVGARFVLVGRTDKRVNLRPLVVRPQPSTIPPPASLKPSPPPAPTSDEPTTDSLPAGSAVRPASTPRTREHLEHVEPPSR